MRAYFSVQRAIVSLQVVRNGCHYLSDDRFKSWLKVEGDGEGMKMWCWVCHAHKGHGAPDGLGTEKQLPSREEKLIRRWPKKDADALLSHGNVQISQLIHTYRAFFQNPNGTSVPGELAETQWKQMKKLIVSDASLSSMKFNELWPMMLDGYMRTAVQFHPACGWHRSHILSRHELLRTLDFPHERPQDQLSRENGTRDRWRAVAVRHV